MKDKEQAQIVSLIGTRDKFVKLRTTLKNKIHNILNANGIISKREMFSSEKSFDSLLEIDIDESYKFELGVIIGEIKDLNKVIDEIDTETFGHNIIEPLFFGIPTISFDVGISEKVIDDFYNGFVMHRKTTPQEFRMRVEYILDNLQEFSNTTSKQILTWEEVAKRYMLLYKMVIMERHKNGKDY